MIKILKHLNKMDLLFVIFSLVFIVVAVFCDLSLPGYMSEITKLVQTPGSEMADIWAAGGMMLLCAFGSLAASFIVAYFAAKVAASLARRLRGEVFDKTMSFSLEEMNRFSTGSLITRSTNDITQIQTLIAMGLQAMLKAPILAVWAITKIMGKSWEWTAATGGAVVFLLVVVVGSITFVIPKFKKIQKQTDNLNQVVRENLTGLQVVRAYNAEGFQEKKFEKANQELTNTNLFVNRVIALIQTSMSFVMSAISLAIYAIGAVLINNSVMEGKLTLFSDMVVFSSYAMQIIMAFMMLILIFVLVPRASVSAHRISEVLETDPIILDGKKSGSKTQLKGEIEFKDVSFEYPGANGYAIEDISFTANKGETVAFIGATGSGKSTLINLIPRFYDTTKGEVLVDGINVREYTQEALRNKIGYVSQKATLFSGTISSNIAYGENGKTPASDNDVKNAVLIAQAKEFVDEKEGNYDAPVSQGGANLSGGQKQRVSIARAICRDPEILIFDDSFSALDYKTDKKLRNALKEKTTGITHLIVAQRIGTIKDADKIIVLEKGKVVGMGKHEELLKDCPIYQEISLSQLSKEELNHA